MKYLLVLTLPLLFAFNFNPMTKTISLADGVKSVQFQVFNNTESTIPVTIKVVERVQKEDGKEELPATSDLKVFPPQLIIPKGAKRSVRVDWIGGKDFKVEKSYRVIAEQVPLDVDKKSKGYKGGIKMLMRFMSALYVDPGSTSGKLSISKIVNFKNKVRVFLKNSGTKHQYLKNVEISITDGERNVAISKKELKKLEGHNVLAGSTRYFDFDSNLKITSKHKGILKFDK